MPASSSGTSSPIEHQHNLGKHNKSTLMIKYAHFIMLTLEMPNLAKKYYNSCISAVLNRIFML